MPEKSKNLQEIDFLLKNEPIPAGVAMSELSNGTKKHTSKSRETIPLKGQCQIVYPLGLNNDSRILFTF
jgi:hypothetical protein